MRLPGFRSPRFSASAIIARPTRSFTLPPGLADSTFTRISALPRLSLLIRTSGVCPISSAALFAMCPISSPSLNRGMLFGKYSNIPHPRRFYNPEPYPCAVGRQTGALPMQHPVISRSSVFFAAENGTEYRSFLRDRRSLVRRSGDASEILPRRFRSGRTPASEAPVESPPGSRSCIGRCRPDDDEKIWSDCIDFGKVMLIS